jgi:hypothetical protein
MHHVGSSEFGQEQWDVAQLSDHRPEVLDPQGAAEPSGRDWVDRDEPRVNLRIPLPGANQPVGLHGLASKDAHRRRHDRDVQPSPPVAVCRRIHCAPSTA